MLYPSLVSHKYLYSSELILALGKAQWGGVSPAGLSLPAATQPRDKSGRKWIGICKTLD